MRKTELKMRIISMLLCFLMVFTSIPTDAFAAEIGTTIENVNAEEENKTQDTSEASKEEITEDNSTTDMEASFEVEIEEILEDETEETEQEIGSENPEEETGLQKLRSTLRAVNTAWDGSTVTQPNQDENNVYQIGSAEELAWFAGLVNGTLDKIAQNGGAYAVLTADIDLNNKEWTPIGNSTANTYRGTFDGAGHTISGLKVSAAAMYAGLFGNVAGINALIKDLTVKGSVTAAGNFNGGIAGKIGQSGKIENCISYVNITASGNAQHIGGIAGNSNKSTITECINYGDIQSEGTNTGGIVGYLHNTATIEKCTNEGIVFSTAKEYVGGIAGKISNCTITGCYNTGMVIGNSGKVGGISGSVEKTDGSITDCYNLGTIIGTAGTAAGIVGENKGTVANCYTVSSMKLAGENIGNIAGASTGTVTNCYYLKDVLTISDSNGTAKTASEMKASDFITTLGASFKAGCSYPILSWQTDGTHTYDEATGKCTGTGCESKVTHVWKDATCTEPMTCTICKETRGSKIGHVYAEGVCVICNTGDSSVTKDPFEIRLSENTDKLSYETLPQTNVRDGNIKYYFVKLNQLVSSVFFAVGDEAYNTVYDLNFSPQTTVSTTVAELDLSKYAVELSRVLIDTSAYDTDNKVYYAFSCIEKNFSDYFYVVLEVPKPAEKTAPTAMTLPESMSMFVGSTVTLSPVVTPEDADPEVTWKSSDPSIATVDAKGGVYGKSAGTVKITATSKKASSVQASTTFKISDVNKYTVDWAGTFNNRYDNNNISSVKLPTDSKKISESWTAAVGNSTIAIVGDYIYTYACAQGMSGFQLAGTSQTFYKIDKETGTIVRTTPNCPGKGSYYYGYTIYGGKYIYVSCPNALMAFDPDTCEMVWSNTDKNLGNYCCAQYVNGYLVVNGMVFNGSTGAFVKDLDGDYSYSNGATFGNYFYVADYNGVLYGFNTTTWEKVDSIRFKTDNTAIQPGVLYHNGKLYWGDAIKTNIYSIELDAKGLLKDDTFTTTNCGYTTTCTPVAYGDRVYLAGQSGQLGIVGVFAADDLHVIYKTPTGNSIYKIQDTPILYADNENTVYLWMQAYNKSTVYYLVDTPVTSSGSLKELVTPSVTQYAWEQIACDKDGALYVTNDIGLLFKFEDAKAAKPTVNEFTTTSFTYQVGDTATALTVSAFVTDGGTLSYQWQSSNDGTTWSNISGATAASYTPSTAAGSKGTNDYRCVVKNTYNGGSAITISGKVSVTVEATGTISVKLSILGDSKHNSDTDGTAHTLAGGNLTTWVAEQTYNIDANATVWDLIQKVLKENNMTCTQTESLGTVYIQDITYQGLTLGAYTNGKNSGWMYTINGVHSNYGVAQQYMQDGDIIILHYTDDYTKEDNSGTKVTVEEVIALIEQIPSTITLDCKDKIEAARAAYTKLEASEQSNVTNYQKLLDAEKALKALQQSNANIENVYLKTGNYLGSLGTPNVGSVGGEWMVIGLARSGKTVPTGYFDNVVSYVKQNIDSSGRLHTTKSTDNSRLILALTAAGYDPRNVGGYNLVTALSDMDYVEKQGINGPIWALIALNSHSYATLSAGAENLTTRTGLVKKILSAQLTDGGWALSGTEADSDMTGMALQALAPYYDSNATVKAAVDKALTKLSAMQEDNGAFATVGTITSESTAQVIVALSALGIDADTDSRFIKNGFSAMDALLSFAVDGGGFAHLAGGSRDGMATEQGYYALTAYMRMLEGKTSLYDMSDVTLKTGTVNNDTNNSGNSGSEDKDQAAAKKVEALINTIDTVTVNSGSQIRTIRAAYEKLTASQKKLVSNYEKLTKAEETYGNLKAAQVEKLIAAIGKVTLNSKEKINAARTAYRKLDAAYKAKVSNLAVLEAAEEAYKVLLTASKKKTASKKSGTEETEEKEVPTEKVLAVKEQLAALTEASLLNDLLEAVLAYEALTEEEKETAVLEKRIEELKAMIADSVHTDAVTGISVSGVEWNIQLVVEEITAEAEIAECETALGENSLLKLWNIDLIDLLTGESYEPEKEVLVKLPLELLDNVSSYDGLVIVHYAEDGTMEYLDCTLIGDCIAFHTVEFSNYAVVGYQGLSPLEHLSEAAVAEASEKTAWIPWTVAGCFGAALLAVLVILANKNRKNVQAGE